MLHKSYTNPTQKSINDLINLSKLLVGSVEDPVAEWVDMGTQTESESTELTIYIRMADSVKFRWSPELFFGLVCKLLFIPGIILIPTTADDYSRSYSRSSLPTTSISRCWSDWDNAGTIQHQHQ